VKFDEKGRAMVLQILRDLNRANGGAVVAKDIAVVYKRRTGDKRALLNVSQTVRGFLKGLQSQDVVAQLDGRSRNKLWFPVESEAAETETEADPVTDDELAVEPGEDAAPEPKSRRDLSTVPAVRSVPYRNPVQLELKQNGKAGEGTDGLVSRLAALAPDIARVVPWLDDDDRLCALMAIDANARLARRLAG